jgi:hypothetical protein
MLELAVNDESRSLDKARIMRNGDMDAAIELGVIVLGSKLKVVELAIRSLMSNERVAKRLLKGGKAIIDGLIGRTDGERLNSTQRIGASDMSSLNKAVNVGAVKINLSDPGWRVVRDQRAVVAVFYALSDRFAHLLQQRRVFGRDGFDGVDVGVLDGGRWWGWNRVSGWG